jgi:hypothetical protein
MIPLPGGSSPFLFLPSKLRHPASQPVHSPPPTTPPAVVQTGCRPNRGHTTAFVSREDAKTRRETQWSSARGQIGRSDSPERRGATGSGDTPHFNRGIPRHSAEAYHSTGIYPTTGTYHSTAVQHTCGAVDTPPRSSHAKTRRRERKRSGRRRGGQAGAGDTPLQRRGRSGGHTTSATGSGDTPHSSRGIPHHSAGAYRSIGTYRSTGIRPNRGHTTAFVSREDAKRNAVVFGTGDKSAGDGPEPWTHHPVCLTRRREDAKGNAVVVAAEDKSGR